MKITRYNNPTSTSKYDSLFVITQGNQSVVFTVEELYKIQYQLRTYLRLKKCTKFSNEVYNDSRLK